MTGQARHAHLLLLLLLLSLLLSLRPTPALAAHSAHACSMQTSSWLIPQVHVHHAMTVTVV